MDARPAENEPPTRTPPTGAVTFLFTDIEGSTLMLQRLGDGYAEVLVTHQNVLRQAFAAHDGYEVDTQGDSFFVAFPTAPRALAAAAQATRALAAHTWPAGERVRVRMGLHTGAPQALGARYVGLDVHRAARIAAAGHGGQILLSAPAAEMVRVALPDDITLRDLGSHRLKDLQQAEHIYQAILAGQDADFPPLKSLGGRPHNLPVQPAPLVGRERELADVQTLLRRDDVRLVTLTGPGGVGKTRLSLQAAAESLDVFPDGVWWVQLSRITDPSLVIDAIAQALSVKQSGPLSLAEALTAYMRDKRLLLVFDNFEQVTKAAGEVGALLATCPGVTALATSRISLGLTGEHEYALRPLETPDPQRQEPLERLIRYPAVALFVERAREAQASFTLTNANAAAVAGVCAQLDGLPLAIQLAAARVKVLPPAALLARLERQLPLLTGGARDLEERQQTMRAAIAWSEDLLSLEERRLFRRLAVFVDGATLEMIEAVCAAPTDAEPLGIDTLDGVSRLVDQSLIQRREDATDDADGSDEPRFSMLRVIREYALERLEAAGETRALRLALAHAYLNQLEPHWFQNDALPFAPYFRYEHGLPHEVNTIRAALEAANQLDQTDLLLRLAASLGPLWMRYGLNRDGLRWSEVALERGAGAAATRETVAARAALLGELASIRLNRGEDAHVILPTQEEAVTLARSVGSSTLLAMSLDGYAAALIIAGDFERGEAAYEEVIQVARRDGMFAQLVNSLLNYCSALLTSTGREERAESLAEEALTIGRERQSLDAMSWAKSRWRSSRSAMSAWNTRGQ